MPTIHGRDDLKVKAGTQSGSLFSLKGQGIPNVRTGRKGDQIVRVAVEVPKKLSPKQEELIRQLAELQDDEVDQGKGFWARLGL